MFYICSFIYFSKTVDRLALVSSRQCCLLASWFGVSVNFLFYFEISCFIQPCRIYSASTFAPQCILLYLKCRSSRFLVSSSSSQSFSKSCLAPCFHSSGPQPFRYLEIHPCHSPVVTYRLCCSQLQALPSTQPASFRPFEHFWWMSGL